MDRSSPGQTLSPRAARVVRGENAKRALRRIIDRHEVTQAQLATWMGKPPQHVSECLDPESDRHFSMADWGAVEHDACRVEGAEAVAMGPRFVAVRRHEGSATALTVGEAARMLRAASCAVDSMLEALADGHADPAEKRDILRRLEPLLQHCEELRGALLADEVPAPKPLRSVP